MPQHYKWKLVHSTGGYRVMYLGLYEWREWMRSKKSWYDTNLVMKDIVLADWLIQENELQLSETVKQWNKSWLPSIGTNDLEYVLNTFVTNHFYE